MANTQKIDLNKLIPSGIKNETLTSLVSNLFNRFVSEEQSVLISGQIGKIIDANGPVIQQTDLDRELNALVPALYAKTGTEESINTFDDLVSRLKSIGVNTNNLQDMLKEQNFNFAPPIDIDKFVNYSEYFWVPFLPRASEPTWNPSRQPEYYVIAPPSATDVVKIPVRLATTRNIKLYGKDRLPETVTLTFVNSTQFTISGTNGPLALSPSAFPGTTTGTLTGGGLAGTVTTFNVYAPDSFDASVFPGANAGNRSGMDDQDGLSDVLFSFDITPGTSAFQNGDKFEITITYVTGSNVVSFIGAFSNVGKGFISNIVADTLLMFVDGQRVSIGDRVLAWRQTNAAENGVYIVSRGKWTRAPDISDELHLPLGSLIYVKSGTINSSKLFSLSSRAADGTFQIDNPVNGQMTFTASSSVQRNPVNAWQEFNFWVHRTEIEQLGITDYVQATRPIIEYHADLQLNSFFDGSNYPSETGTAYEQQKTRFNQIPQFDLFRYDGTHSRKTSSIFFYKEDFNYAVDSALARRVKTTVNSDYVFGLGIQDDANRLLFFKRGGQLQTVWSAGVTSSFATTPLLSSQSLSGKGTLTINALSPLIDNEDWKVTAASSTTFSVIGSRSGQIGIASLGNTVVGNGLITLNIVAGVNAFQASDSFSFSTHNKNFPRFVERRNEQILNVLGGPASNANGAWLTPRRMFENLERSLKSEISFGDMLDHFRTIMQAQDGFSGSSFGLNNFRNLDSNLGLGGSIREYSGNFPLLASMLIEKDLSPLSILDFAETQYLFALSSIDQFLISNLANYISESDVISISSINANSSGIQQLLASYEQTRAEDVMLQAVFSDSSAAVKNWPATLPILGITQPVLPTVGFDLTLGIDVIVHHDGHVSPLSTGDTAFDRSIVQTIVKRSDGTSSAGFFSESSPLNPYAKQIWMKPSTLQVAIFDVISDKDVAPAGSIGAFWYKKSTNVLYEWDDVAKQWNVSASTVLSRWIPVNTAAIRNSLILAVEQKLFAGIHQSISVKIDVSDVEQDPLAQIELAKFAAKYQYDTFAPDYVAASAFTWNYSQASFPNVTAGTARWFDIYEQYFSRAGSLPTARPNLEPWRILGYASKQQANTALGINWDTLYASATPDRMWKTQMWNNIKAARPGVKLCVNINTDELLPPYVSSTLAESTEALTTQIPLGSSAPYEFGENGPVELVWKKSLEYRYGLARVLFKKDPMNFLDATWGDTYVYANGGVRLERELSRPLPSSMFLLHGEKLHVPSTHTSASISGTVTSTTAGSLKFRVTHVEDNKTFFNIFNSVGLVYSGFTPIVFEEGTTTSIPQIGTFTFNNLRIDDHGVPFKIGDEFTLFAESAQSNVEQSNEINPEDCGCVIDSAEQVIIDSSLTYRWVFSASNVKKFIGLGQLFTNLIRYNYIDTDESQTVNNYRGWDVRLVHRIGSLIRNDSLKMTCALGVLPETAYSVLIKRSKTGSAWISGLRVQLVQAGARVINAVGDYIPHADGNDWVYRIEVFNPQHPTIEYYVLDTSDEFQTFNALAKQSTGLAWKRHTERLTLQTATMPMIVTGIQNVINIIFGYVDRLEELGWQVNAGETQIVDDETGRNLDWQLEVEKFVDRCYRRMAPGEGHILNPFMNAMCFNTPVGLMSEYSNNTFIDINSSQAVFDSVGGAIPISDLQVIRTDENTITYSDTAIFSAHVYIDEYEHAVLFNNTISAEDTSLTIFDPFLGIRINSAYMSYIRQDIANRKPTFNGFFISGNEIKRNITSSANAIASYYDAGQTFFEEPTAKHALSLLGYSKKKYFSDLGISDATQFNFWRGLIQAKGTNITVDAFINYKRFIDASADEYWAYKVAEFGDARSRSLPEIKIEQNDCQSRFTPLQFYSADDTSYVSLPSFIQIEKEDGARWFSIDDLGKGIKFDAQPFKVEKYFPIGYHIIDIFHNDGQLPVVETAGAVMVNANTINVTTAGVHRIVGHTWFNPTKLSPVKLFDYQENVAIKNIGIWHPAIGIHANEGLEIVNNISKFDPALYNYSTQTSNNPNYMTVKPWGAKEVGVVWWDTSNLGYVPYFDSAIFPDRNERFARWGSLAEWATVDLYEWIESSVSPQEYNALALKEEGNSEIDSRVKASGKAARKQFYSRTRAITARPIAWSKAGIPSASSHPSFGPAFSVKVTATGGVLFTETGRTADANIVSGRHFAAWANGKPAGEAVILDDIVFDLGSSAQIASPVTSVAVSIIDGGRLGNRIGQISLSLREVAREEVINDVANPGELISATSITYFLKMSDAFGFFEEVEVLDTFTPVQFTDFGIKISGAGTSVETFVSAAVSGWTNVYIREGIRYSEIMPLPAYEFANDDSNLYEYGWKTWEVPTQDELNADLVYPRNTWQPYLGDNVNIDVTSDIISQMKDSSASFKLRNGISINRFVSTWSDWSALSNVKVEKISNGLSELQFLRSTFIQSDEPLNTNRLSIYANGIQITPQSYTVLGAAGQEVVKLVNKLPRGTQTLLVYRSYEPTETDLAFDPDVEDNVEIETQYKADYQYTKVDVRNEAGAISSAKYYFWVQDKTIAQQTKSMSLVQAKNILANGPSQFMVFARQTGAQFDSIAIAGLKSLVKNNNTYKLRFIRDLTLRDDPQQLDLKNTHTEWALIRKSQTSKIPKTLWDKITDAAAGTTAGGSKIPAQNRIDYDLQHGTSSRFGFKPGQIFADTQLVRTSITSAILNTKLRLRTRDTEIIDYISALDFDNSDLWFNSAEAARQTMNTIWNTARARQVNEIFFEVLEDALANNYEFGDLFKTSFISVKSTTSVASQTEGEIQRGIF